MKNLHVLSVAALAALTLAAAPMMGASGIGPDAAAHAQAGGNGGGNAGGNGGGNGGGNAGGNGGGNGAGANSAGGQGIGHAVATVARGEHEHGLQRAQAVVGVTPAAERATDPITAALERIFGSGETEETAD